MAGNERYSPHFIHQRARPLTQQMTVASAQPVSTQLTAISHLLNGVVVAAFEIIFCAVDSGSLDHFGRLYGFIFSELINFFVKHFLN